MLGLLRFLWVFVDLCVLRGATIYGGGAPFRSSATLGPPGRSLACPLQASERADRGLARSPTPTPSPPPLPLKFIRYPGAPARSSPLPPPSKRTNHPLARSLARSLAPPPSPKEANEPFARSLAFPLPPSSPPPPPPLHTSNKTNRPLARPPLPPPTPSPLTRQAKDRANSPLDRSPPERAGERVSDPRGVLSGLRVVTEKIDVSGVYHDDTDTPCAAKLGWLPCRAVEGSTRSCVLGGDSMSGTSSSKLTWARYIVASLARCARWRTAQTTERLTADRGRYKLAMLTRSSLLAGQACEESRRSRSLPPTVSTTQPQDSGTGTCASLSSAHVRDCDFGSQQSERHSKMRSCTVQIPPQTSEGCAKVRSTQTQHDHSADSQISPPD